MDDGRILDEVIVRRKDTDPIYGTETVEIGCHAGGAAARVVIDSFLKRGAACVTFQEALETALAQRRINKIELDARLALRNCLSEKAIPVLLAELAEHLLEREIKKIFRLVENDTAGNIEKAMLQIRHLLNCTGIISYVEPQRVFITGFPNVGKSSLFNSMTGMERVIVHDTPGTTRDVVEELTFFDEVPVRLFDSAGVGQQDTVLENMPQEFTFRLMKEAALVLFVFDGSRPAKEEELKLYTQLDCAERIHIINKTDLPRVEDRSIPCGALEVSALTGSGVPELRSLIAERLAPRRAAVDRLAVFTREQKNLLGQALKALETADFSKGLELLHRLLG